MPQFKYLFKALFHDKTTIDQTADDNSIITPGKNSFYDVLKQLENVRAFALYNQETNNEYLVDLSDGHFEINQIPFKLHEEEYITNIRLIYFRRNYIHSGAGETIHEVHYFFGWQANDERGQNVKKLMKLS